jgi:hypothetical protein
MTLPDAVDNETYVSSNLITTIISTNAGDNQNVRIEGHIISGGDFTFSSQTATLNGQTAVALGTPIARVTAVTNISATEMAGLISVTEDDTFTAGVPNTNAKVHLQVFAGEQKSEKGATTISSVDYWVVTKFYCDMLTKAAANAEVDLEVCTAGGVFIQVASISCSNTHSNTFKWEPYLIIPPNSDVRLRAVSDSATGRDVSGGIIGALLKA